jgi:hypothetical protein
MRERPLDDPRGRNLPIAVVRWRRRPSESIGCIKAGIKAQLTEPAIVGTRRSPPRVSGRLAAPPSTARTTGLSRDSRMSQGPLDRDAETLRRERTDLGGRGAQTALRR